jgi:alanine-synthesizing transaminase
VQVAAAAALNGPQACIEEIRATYRARRDCLVESFARAGWDVPPPPASMFAWAPIPAAYRQARNIKRFLARSRDSMHNVIPIPQKASG